MLKNIQGRIAIKFCRFNLNKHLNHWFKYYNLYVQLRFNVE